MGWFYRKTKKLRPLRVTGSRRGSAQVVSRRSVAGERPLDFGAYVRFTSRITAFLWPFSKPADGSARHTARPGGSLWRRAAGASLTHPVFPTFRPAQKLSRCRASGRAHPVQVS